VVTTGVFCSSARHLLNNLDGTISRNWTQVWSGARVVMSSAGWASYSAQQSYSFASGCICYAISHLSVRPFVCPSHSGIMSKRGNERDAVFTSGSPVSLVFWCQEWLMGDNPVQTNLSAKGPPPLKTAELYIFRMITPQPQQIAKDFN